MMTFEQWIKAVKFQITNIDKEVLDDGTEMLVFSYTSPDRKSGTNFYLDWTTQKGLCVEVVDIENKEAHSLRVDKVIYAMHDVAYYDYNTQEELLFKIYGTEEEKEFKKHFNKIIKRAIESVKV